MDCTTTGTTTYNVYGQSLLLDDKNIALRMLIQIKFKQVSFFLFMINYMKKTL